jgi:hypothetical protein
MNKQGIIIGAFLIFFANLFIRAIGFNEEIGAIKPKLWIALFLYVFAIFFYFSVLHIEFDADKLEHKKTYGFLSMLVAFFAIAAFYGITEQWRIREKVETLLGNKGKHINEYLVMAGVFLIGVAAIYLFELAKKEVKEVVDDI